MKTGRIPDRRLSGLFSSFSPEHVHFVKTSPLLLAIRHAAETRLTRRSTGSVSSSARARPNYRPNEHTS